MSTIYSRFFPRTVSACGLVAAAAALLPSVALSHGNESDPSTTNASPWALGLVVMPEKKPYRDYDNKTEVLPFFTYENRWVRVAGPGLELKLGQDGPVRWGLTASYAGDGYKSEDSPYLSGMADRKSSFWLGARMGLRTDLATFSAEWSADASSKSQGQKIKLGVERRFSVGSLGITPRLTATWLDSKYVQYYYGVESNEARAGRTAYNAGSAVNTELGLRMDYQLARQHMVFADLGVTSLGNSIKNSPLVSRNNVPEVRLGYMYRF